MVMLSHVAEQVRWPDGRRVEIGGREQLQATPDAHGTGYLTEFRLEAGLPVWRYDVDGLILEKRLFLTHMQNTVHVMYELVAGADRVELGAAAVGELPPAGSAGQRAARLAVRVPRGRRSTTRSR